MLSFVVLLSESVGFELWGHASTACATAAVFAPKNCNGIILIRVVCCIHHPLCAVKALSADAQVSA
jgi:hypothetical protein